MSILVSEQTLLRRWRTLNPDQQKTALDFVEFLGQKPNKPKQQRRDLLGSVQPLGFVSVQKKSTKHARRCGIIFRETLNHECLRGRHTRSALVLN